MAEYAQLLIDRRVAVTNLSADEPPGTPSAEWVDITGFRVGPRLAPAESELVLVGDQVADQTITGGKVWARSTDTNGPGGGVAVFVGYLPAGAVISTTKAIAISLRLAGYTHIAVSGVASAGGLDAAKSYVAPIERMETCL